MEWGDFYFRYSHTICCRLSFPLKTTRKAGQILFKNLFKSPFKSIRKALRYSSTRIWERWVQHLGLISPWSHLLISLADKELHRNFDRLVGLQCQKLDFSVFQREGAQVNCDIWVKTTKRLASVYEQGWGRNRPVLIKAEV